MGLTDWIFVKDEPGKPQQKAPVPIPEPSSAVRRYAATASIVDNDPVYKKLYELTKFEDTATAETIRKYREPLATSGMDEDTKTRTAITIAASVEHLKPEVVIATFDGLKANLSAEATSFEEWATTQEKSEVLSYQANIEKMKDQIASRKAEIATLEYQLNEASDHVSECQTKISKARSQFKAAMERRAMELDDQKSQYTKLLSK